MQTMGGPHQMATMQSPYYSQQQQGFSPRAPSYPGGSSHIGDMDGAQDTGERRRVRSVILDQQLLGPAPEETVRYVEVPYVEEVVRHVPKREIVEIEKHVPKIEYQYVDRVVEVPQIQYVDKVVEVPQVHEIVKHVPRKEFVDVPREYVTHVPKIEVKTVEKVVEVPGEIIEVPKPYTVENKVFVPQHVDKEVPMVVAQTLRPVLTESNEVVDVDVFEYEPEVIPVDIHVPRAVQSELLAMGVVEEQHRLVRVPPQQYNSMLRMLNPHLAETDASALPYVTSEAGAVPFMPQNEPVPHVKVPANTVIEGYTAKVQQSQDAYGAAYSPPYASAGVKSRGVHQHGASAFGAPAYSNSASPYAAAAASDSQRPRSGADSRYAPRSRDSRDRNAKRLSKNPKKPKGIC